MIGTLRARPALADYAPSPDRAFATRLPLSRPRSAISTPPLVGSEPTRTGASGPRLHVPHRFNTTGGRATAPPAGGTHPATGSTTATGTRPVGMSARSDTAPGSAPRRT